MLEITTVLSHSVVTSAVPNRDAIIFDCGANRGEFAQWAQSRFAARVFSFEADPKLAESLPVVPGVTSLNIAIGATDGQMHLRRHTKNCTSAYYNEGGNAGDAFSVECRSLESFCSEKSIKHIDLLKLDIEGAELSVLETGTPSFFGMVSQVTCEFHDFLDPSEIPRIKKVLVRMRRLGFLVICMSYRTYGDVLMLNKSHIKLGAASFSKLQVHKYVNGLGRIMQRIINREE